MRKICRYTNAANTTEITKYVLNRFSFYVKIKNFINVQITFLDFLFRLYRQGKQSEASCVYGRNLAGCNQNSRRASFSKLIKL